MFLLYIKCFICISNIRVLFIKGLLAHFTDRTHNVHYYTPVHEQLTVTEYVLTGQQKCRPARLETTNVTRPSLLHMM